MKRHGKPACILLLMGTLLFGGLYPLVVWSIASFVLPAKAQGSKIYIHEKCVGLRYVGQMFAHEKYFWGRPSWAYRIGNRLVSGGSNLSWSSPLLRANVESKSRIWRQYGQEIPEDIVMASASGCDPEISLRAALFQVPRVALIRGIPEEHLLALIAEYEEPTLGNLFPNRVNVLLLNRELDIRFS